MQIEGKIALVTGGAVRVGRAITLGLAQAGAHVAINYHHSAEEAEATAVEARALGVGALAVRADVSDWDAVQAMAQAVEARFGGVDILVNAAGLFARTPFPSTDPAALEMWRRVTRISVDGPWYVCNAFVPAMRRRGGGAIVNIVDMAVWEPWRGLGAHGVGKAALLGLTQQLALELAPEIRVNAVAPGNVLPPPHFTQEQIDRFARRALLGRWGTPQDVAAAVRYLVEADFATGEVLRIDGGELLNRV